MDKEDIKNIYEVLCDIGLMLYELRYHVDNDFFEKSMSNLNSILVEFENKYNL